MLSRDLLQDTALEHLRIIRTLMERAHIYRSVSAPAALIGGGVLSLGVAAFVYWANNASDGVCLQGTFLLLLWYGVLIITGIVNMILLMRESSLKGERPFGDGMRMALRSLVPPMLTGGILGSYLIWTYIQRRTWSHRLDSLLWPRATGHRELRSEIHHFTGTGLPYYRTTYGPLLCSEGPFLGPLARATAEFPDLNGGHMFVDPSHFITIFKQQSNTASLFLGLTFGVYHIIYAVCVFASKPQPAEAERFIEAP